MDCPFCAPPPSNLIYEGELVLGLWDGFPVSPGHALIVPKRHVLDWFAATRDEQMEIIQVVENIKTLIEKSHKPDGYNIGFNCGEAAGQTVFHLHLHVIPRYAGDMDDPRGGVRHVIPHKARYWKED